MIDSDSVSFFFYYVLHDCLTWISQAIDSLARPSFIRMIRCAAGAKTAIEIPTPYVARKTALDQFHDHLKTLADRLNVSSRLPHLLEDSDSLLVAKGSWPSIRNMRRMDSLKW